MASGSGDGEGDGDGGDNGDDRTGWNVCFRGWMLQ